MDSKTKVTSEMDEFYTGVPGNRREDGWRNLPLLETAKLLDPKGYITDPGAADAVRVALTLGQPLLITGDPGCGKTLLASAVAYELGIEAVRKFETKSTTQARDLFYVFDNLGRLNAVQLLAANRLSDATAAEAVNFISYQALGEAVLFANEPDKVSTFFPRAFKHPGRQRSVVLIDEIDKAPRDVPNDVLNEIEGMYFRIPELGGVKAETDPAWRPVVFLTSNSEKGLPDAFLRRCIYYHMKFPEPARLEQIVASRVAHRFAKGVVNEMLAFFMDARSPKRGLRRQPGVADLLMWFSAAVRRQKTAVDSLAKAPMVLGAARTTLFKTREDQEIGEQMIAAFGTASQPR